MATTILDAVTAGTADTVPNFTVSSGSNRVAFVLAIHSHGTNAAPATSCTLGGQTMDVIATVDDDANTFDVCCTLFALRETGIAAMSGSTISPSGGTYTGRLFFTWSVQGATQGTLTPATAATSGTSGSVSLTRVNDSYTVGFTVQDFVGTAFTGLANPSEAGEATATNIDAAYGYNTDTAGTSNFTWTHSTARNNVTLVLNIAPSSSDTTAPTLSSATIGTNGNTVTLAFSETVNVGSGGNGGFAITPSGGAATLTYSSGSGSSSLVYTASRTIMQGETATIAYTQPGNGIEDAAGNDLANFSGTSVTNNSTQTSAPSISGLSDATPNYLGSLTLTGTGFPTSQSGSAGITIGGVAQTVTWNTSTSCSIASIARGSLKYGVSVNVVVTNAAGTSSTGYATTLSPQTGWAYVNVTTPLATTGKRIASTPEATTGDQFAYGNVQGGVIGDLTVNANLSFDAASGVTAFDGELNDGVWGDTATQYVTYSAATLTLLHNAAKSIGRSIGRSISKR